MEGKCLICNSENQRFSTLYTHDRDSKKKILVLCKNCNLEYLQDFKKNRRELYSENYWVDSNLKPIKKIKLENSNDLLENIVKMKKGGNLLDIGGGDGDFAETASKFFNVDVVDFNISKSREDTEKIRYIRKNVMEFKAEKKYEVICLISCIEHISEPKKLLGKIDMMLANDGIIVIFAPMIDTLGRIILKSRWQQYKDEHIFYYSEKSMDFLFSEFGFKKEKCIDFFTKISINYAKEYLKNYRVFGMKTTLSPVFRLLSILPENILDFGLPNILSGEKLSIYKRQE